MQRPDRVNPPNGHRHRPTPATASPGPIEDLRSREWCEELGHEVVLERIGVDNTGLAFNSVMAVELQGGHPRNWPSGLYERSGEWLFEIGLPGKSGVSGGIVTIAPGKGGLGTFSPRLDEAGNSVRGQRLTAFLSRRLGLNLFASAVHPPDVSTTR